MCQDDGRRSVYARLECNQALEGAITEPDDRRLAEHSKVDAPAITLRDWANGGRADGSDDPGWRATSLENDVAAGERGERRRLVEHRAGEAAIAGRLDRCHERRQAGRVRSGADSQRERVTSSRRGC